MISVRIFPYRLTLSLFFCTFIYYNLFSQQSLDKVDSARILKPRSSARKAAIMSTCLPGLGQVQNKKYWKVPIIYTLLGGMGYFIYSNHVQYKDFQNAIVYRYDNIQGNETFNQYSVENLVTLKRSFRRFRDFSIFGAGAIYLLQIIDANVDAHLMNFDVENISFKVSPEYLIDVNGPNRNYLGINLTLSPKK